MIQVSSRDFEITEAIREEIQSLTQVLDTHFDEQLNIQVVLSKTAPDVFRVLMQAHYMGEDIVSHHESHNFHKALDLCKEHFTKQADKHREKRQEKVIS